MDQSAWPGRKKGLLLASRLFLTHPSHPWKSADDTWDPHTLLMRSDAVMATIFSAELLGALCGWITRPFNCKVRTDTLPCLSSPYGERLRLPVVVRLELFTERGSEVGAQIIPSCCLWRGSFMQVSWIQRQSLLSNWKAKWKVVIIFLKNTLKKHHSEFSLWLSTPGNSSNCT